MTGINLRLTGDQMDTHTTETPYQNNTEFFLIV